MPTPGDTRSRELSVHVAGYSDSDGDERAELAARLRGELRQLAVDDVSSPPAGSPPGAKGSTLEWAQLIVTFTGSLAPLLSAVRGWLDRHPGAAIELEIDGDRLALDDASAEERQELIAAWMARHGR